MGADLEKVRQLLMDPPNLSCYCSISYIDCHPCTLRDALGIQIEWEAKWRESLESRGYARWREVTP